MRIILKYIKLQYTSKTQVDALDSMLSPKPILVNNLSHTRN